MLDKLKESASIRVAFPAFVRKIQHSLKIQGNDELIGPVTGRPT